MTKKIIQKKLIECNEYLEKIAKLLQEVREMDQKNNFSGYRDLALEIARNAERFTCMIRGLVSDTIFSDKREFMLDLSKSQGITIEKEEEWLKIVMPFLLPKRRLSQSCSFILDPLNYALRIFKDNNKTILYDDCVICFRYIYTENGKSIKDHDNIETKKILDEITSYFLVDDGGLFCSNLYTTAMGENENTEIYVIPKTGFNKWLEIYSI